jgi:ABC-2 type transport system permease protein
MDDISASSDQSTSSAPKFKHLVTVVAHKRVALLARYPVNTAVLFLSMFLFFALIFFGGRSVGGPAITDSLDGLIVGFFLWTLATTAFRGLADDVMNEARWGTLERLYMSPFQFSTVMGVKTLVNLCYSLVYSLVFLLAMMLVTGRWLHVEPLTVVVLAALTLAPVVGLGLITAGLAILFKRIESLFGLVTFGFVALIVAPVAQFPLLKLLPMTQGSYLLRRAMEDGLRLWEFAPVELAVLALTGCLYLVAGLAVFSKMQSRARVNGVLGHY